MCQVNRKNRSFFYTNIDGNVYNVVCSRHRVIQKKCPAGKFNTAQTMKVQCRKKKTPKKVHTDRKMRIKAESMVGDRRLRTIPGFRQGWQTEIRPFLHTKTNLAANLGRAGVFIMSQSD